MRNKRRANTAFEREGTETGSVTYTVTLYPDDFEEDAAIVELLENKGRRRLRSIYIREALITFFRGGSAPVAAVIKERPRSRMANPDPLPADIDKTSSNEVAKSLGLKLGKK